MTEFIFIELQINILHEYKISIESFFKIKRNKYFHNSFFYVTLSYVDILFRNLKFLSIL